MVRCYPTLFGDSVPEGHEKDNETEVDEMAWLRWVDTIADGDRTKWEQVLSMSCVEFFNAISFSIYKAERVNKEIDYLIKGKDLQAAQLAISIYIAGKVGIR